MRQQSRFAVLCALLVSSLTLATPSTEERLNALKDQGAREGWTFEVGDTPLMHEPIPEGYDPNVNRAELDRIPHVIPPKHRLPTRWSWKDQGMVSPIKDQAFPQYCGSCWAFGTVAVVESLIKMATGRDVDISEQQLVSCSPRYGTCSGGNFAFGFYKQKGAATEGDFPYQAANVTCKSGLTGTERIKSYAYIGSKGRAPTTEEIKNALYTYGPVAVTVSASGAWNAYKTGVYNACNSNGTNHIVALVGYDDDEQAWILKNSHGTQWGEEGFMRIRYTGTNGSKCNNVGREAVFAVYQ